MSRLYGPLHRSLQDRFDTRRLADNTEARVVLTEIPPEHKAFIESRDMFFCRRSITRAGRPSHIRVAIRASSASSTAVAFPCYDGNGMFYSMGNLLGNRHVGMLFIIFEKPHRLRLQGLATVQDTDPLLPEYPEAQLIVRVAVTEIFRNCPRYVHHYGKIEPSKFVPRSTGKTPIAP